MGNFNLLDEPWISVLMKESGMKKEVSMLEFFQEAGSYQSFVGEMETQNFAVMRFLLAVVQTVFSRFDYQGNVLPGILLDERWCQTAPIDSDDMDVLDDYSDAAEECWDQLYSSGKFPDIIFDYLEKWRDRFYLFDEEHPFFQVNEKEMTEIMANIPNKSQPTTIYGKNLNRTISESENKIALFSPIAAIGNAKRSKKDIMTAAELARWLLTFHGYAGLADKVSLVNKEQKPSKGWLFDLGGLYLRGNTVFETIMMNYMPVLPIEFEQFSGRIQKPCWESDGSTVIHRISSNRNIDNLAELYTNWSRAVYINPKSDLTVPVKINVVKIPEIDHSENSIEPMTIWRKNKTGPNKNHFSLKKHEAEQSLWRSFGIITIRNSINKENKQPGIMEQYQRLQRTAGSRWTDLVGVSMKDDGNATSWLPTDEITDSFQINDLLITDSNPDSWVIRINDAVESTKDVVSNIFKRYLRGICEIRNLKVSNPMDPIAAGFLSRETAQLYAIIDPEFKEWLSSIRPDDSKEKAIKSWYLQLKDIVLKRGKELFENSTARDLTGVETERGIENIATIYWQFVNNVNHALGKGGDS